MDSFEPYAEEPPAGRTKVEYDWPTRLNKLVAIYPPGWYCIARFGNTSGANYWMRKLAGVYPDFEFHTHVSYSEKFSKLYARIFPLERRKGG
jgi:hypothetical protein